MKIRIISGIYKGRRINVPGSDKVRPTTDRVRETLFNILNNQIDFDGISVLDLYAGSGILGLEALSRGAAKVYFIEKNHSFSENIKNNIDSLGIKDGFKVFNMDAASFIKKEPPVKFDLLFADPPYRYTELYNILLSAPFNNLFHDSSVKVIERAAETQKEDTEAFGTEPARVLGNTCLYII
jgi:16S rRNA (guanine966-N2)-methyltransferase